MADNSYIEKPGNVNTLHADHYTLENGYVTARVTGKVTPEAIQIDDKSTNKVAYFGYAVVGSLTSAAVWKMFKTTDSATGTTLLYADGNSDYDNIWDDRVSLTYS